MIKNSSEFAVQGSELKDLDLIKNSSEFRVQSSECFKPQGVCQKPLLRTPNSLLRTQRGFSYVALLVAVIIIGISLGAAGKYWRNVMLREKERELIFRGTQYRLAIESYYKAIPGRPQYPQNIDDLLKDGRTATGKRHLRQKYKDPMTGEDFELVTTLSATASVSVAANPQMAAAPGIKGVHSKSDAEPLKKDNFEVGNEDLVGKSKYSEWLFVAFTGTAQQVVVGGQPGIPGLNTPTGGPTPLGGPTPPGGTIPPGGTTPQGGGFGYDSSGGQQQGGQSIGRPPRIRPRPFGNYPLPDQPAQ